MPCIKLLLELKPSPGLVLLTNFFSKVNKKWEIQKQTRTKYFLLIFEAVSFISKFRVGKA